MSHKDKCKITECFKIVPTEIVSAFGAGKVDTSRPTVEGKDFSFSIEYGCEDSSGNSATIVKRWLRIVCDEGKDYCLDSGKQCFVKSNAVHC